MDSLDKISPVFIKIKKKTKQKKNKKKPPKEKKI
jgi:hypothetical protein